MRSHRFLPFALCFLLLSGCTSPVRKLPPGTAVLVPFNTFLQGVRSARYEDYAGRSGAKVRDQAAFEEMRAHVLKMYDERTFCDMPDGVQRLLRPYRIMDSLAN